MTRLILNTAIDKLISFGWVRSCSDEQSFLCQICTPKITQNAIIVCLNLSVNIKKTKNC